MTVFVSLPTLIHMWKAHDLYVLKGLKSFRAKPSYKNMLSIYMCVCVCGEGGDQFTLAIITPEWLPPPPVLVSIAPLPGKPGGEKRWFVQGTIFSPD
jgi:hypothetical protein